MTPPIRTSAHPEVVSEQIPRAQKGWITLVSSAEHKSVGRMYIATSLFFATAALAELLMMRLQLMVPENTLIRPEIFDRLLSAYGVTALVLFALPLALGLFSIVVPLQIGARGMALPRLHHLSYWLYLFGGITIYGSFLYRPSEAGVIGLPPLSSAEFLQGAAVDAWLTGFALALLGFICFSISMIATIRNSRAPGMALQRMPLFAWAGATASYTLLVVSPIFLAAISMLIIDRHFGGVYFDAGEGGKPMLYEHLASIFLAGATASVLVAGLATISEILATFSRQPQFGHRTIAGSLVAVAVLAVLGWMQSMYSAPIPMGFLYFAMLMALIAVVPIGLIFFNWIGTLSGGAVRNGMPLKYALGAICLLVIALVGRLIEAIVPAGALLAGSTFTSGTTFGLLAGAGVLGGFAGLYYWFPKLSGRMMGDSLGTASFWALFTGVTADDADDDDGRPSGHAGRRLAVLWRRWAGHAQPAHFDRGNRLRRRLHHHDVQRRIQLSPRRRGRVPTPGTAAPSSGSRHHRPPFTTSTSFPTSAARSRSTTSATRSGVEPLAGTRPR